MPAPLCSPHLRSAQPDDNPGLLILSAETPVVTPAFSYVIDRSPDYLAFTAQQGVGSEVQVALSPEGQLLGMLTLMRDQVWLEGRVQEVAYTADLRVCQAARGQGLGDRLMREGTIQAGNRPIFTAVLRDNPVGLKMNANLERDGITLMRPVAKIGLSLLLPFSRHQETRWKVTAATPGVQEEMHALWHRVKRHQHLARAWDLESWQAWLAQAPGLKLSDYLLARDRQGHLCGFLAVWNQQLLRSVRILRYGPLLKGLCQGWNLLHTLLKLPPLPAVGENLPLRQVFNLCIAGHSPGVLVALLQAALRRLQTENALLLGLSLDQNDPLQFGLKGFFGSHSELILLSNYAWAHPGRGIFHLETGLG